MTREDFLRITQAARFHDPVGADVTWASLMTPGAKARPAAVWRSWSSWPKNLNENNG